MSSVPADAGAEPSPVSAGGSEGRDSSGSEALRIVVALGGNALLPREEAREGSGDSGQSSSRSVQASNVALAADVVAALAHHHLVVTHGNGPQVGLLALQTEAAGGDETLDVLGAETEGMIGYVLEREIRSRLPARPVVTLLTQVEVDPDDPAFRNPTKPIGPLYERAEAERLAEERGWSVAPDGDRWRRVVPSPRPRQILELDAIALLLAAGHLVVCGGGGGIPVVKKDGALAGVEGVVDKDRSTALLARELGADLLLLLTDVPAIYRDWPEREHPVRSTTPERILDMDLSAGSMGPKVEAAAWFVETTGGLAVIGALEDAVAMVAGAAGTRIAPGPASEGSPPSTAY